MGRNLLDFYFNLSGIDHTITPSNANDSVAFLSFAVFGNLNRRNRIKAINLIPKRSTITSNKERKSLSRWKCVIISVSIHVHLG